MSLKNLRRIRPQSGHPRLPLTPSALWNGYGGSVTEEKLRTKEPGKKIKLAHNFCDSNPLRKKRRKKCIY